MPAPATVDLGALRANYLQARALLQGRVVAVMKANAYGHGAIRCAKVIADIADTHAVAFTDESPRI
ncbi:MAG: alanine racemase [Limnohabitans sp.]|jgi:alanine racemase|uniref:alanine racemase n=1 Tax=Limnohabitans sp. TaxID=1907725 RepID=UPI00391A2637